MKKFKGLIIPEHEEYDDGIECCMSAYIENKSCIGIICSECLFYNNHNKQFNHWIELGRQCEICEDEE